MEKRDVMSLVQDIKHKLSERYDDKILCDQYAWWMIEAVTNKEQAELLAIKEVDFTQKQLNTLNTWVEKQINEKMPLQYLFGSVPFDDLEILVEPPILIPRPETEEMCYTIIAELQTLKNKKIRILDIGTGTGCIALTLAKALPEAEIWGIDISEQALILAKKNAEHNNIHNATFLHSDLYKQIGNATFDLIVSNPPYIAEDEWKLLDKSVTQWEDKRALVADHEGLAIIEQIIIQAPRFIKQNPEFAEKKLAQLIIEIGYKQGPSTAKLFEIAGFIDIVVEKDLEHKDRFVKGRVQNVATKTEGQT